MKIKLALVIILFLIVIIGGVFQIIIINRTMDYISGELEILDKEVSENIYDIEKVNNLTAYWQKKLPLIETLIPNTEIDQVAMLLAELLGAIENEDRKESNIRIEVLQTKVKSIKHLLGFRFEHIV